MKIYYCTNGEDNICPKRMECMRYTELESTQEELPHAKLYNVMCNQNNDYILYIQATNKPTEDLIEEGDSN